MSLRSIIESLHIAVGAMQHEAAVAENVGDPLPPWAKAAGFKDRHGDYKLWSAGLNYIYYMTPNKGRYRLKYDWATKTLVLPPETASAGPGFTIVGTVPVHPGMASGPNRDLYNLAIEIRPLPRPAKAPSYAPPSTPDPNHPWGSKGWEVQWLMRPSDARGSSPGLKRQTFDTAAAVIKLMDRLKSEKAAGGFLAPFVGQPAVFLEDYVLAEAKLTPEITFQVTNYQPGDFGGFGRNVGEYSIEVENGFAIKDELKKLGFVFEPTRKTWRLAHKRVDMLYPPTGALKRELARQPSEKDVKAAIAKVETLVKQGNEQIVASNAAQLSQAGLGNNDPKNTMRNLAQWSDRQQRSIDKLTKQGLSIVHEYDSGVPGFRKGGGVGKVLVKGNTYPIKDLLKKAGFRWDGGNKTWTIGAGNFTDEMIAKMVQAFARAEDDDEEEGGQRGSQDDESYAQGHAGQTELGQRLAYFKKKNEYGWDGEETPPWEA